MTLAAMMGVLLVFFFAFHAWLMLKATTTIELCEKTYRHSGCAHRGSTLSIYHRGLMENVCAVLGSNVWLWFLPWSPPDGDGLSFRVSEAMEHEVDNDSETAPLLPKNTNQEDTLAYGSDSK